MDSSPGHLFQTSFSQPGFAATLPASKSSREKAGLAKRLISSFVATLHLTSMSRYILLSSGLVFQVDELRSASTDGHRSTSLHCGALADHRRLDFKIDKIVMPGPYPSAQGISGVRPYIRGSLAPYPEDRIFASTATPGSAPRRCGKSCTNNIDGLLLDEHTKRLQYK